VLVWLAVAKPQANNCYSFRQNNFPKCFGLQATAVAFELPAQHFIPPFATALPFGLNWGCAK